MATGAASPCSMRSARTRSARTLCLGHCFAQGCAISKHAGKPRNFGEPAAVIFTFDFKGEFHGREFTLFQFVVPAKAESSTSLVIPAEAGIQ
jgi:hypothetical protein